MAKSFLTMQQLETTATDITYEVCTMLQAYDLYVYCGKRAERSQFAEAYHAAANCALESFLLHYRALKEFLSNTPKRNNDDVKATDYLTGWKATGSWLADSGETARIHKRLAHITTTRGNINGGWNPDQMKEQVLIAFDELIRDLPPHTKPWFSVIEKAVFGKKGIITAGAVSNSTVSVTATTILFPSDLF
jgi:hypothetical protein